MTGIQDKVEFDEYTGLPKLDPEFSWRVVPAPTYNNHGESHLLQLVRTREALLYYEFLWMRFWPHRGIREEVVKVEPIKKDYGNRNTPIWDDVATISEKTIFEASLRISNYLLQEEAARKARIEKERVEEAFTGTFPPLTIRKELLP